MATKEDWTAWFKERDSFKARETQGFSRDLKALETHIKTLDQVCPKDEAGWPVVTALRTIDALTADYNRFKTYLEFLTG